jgi:hypothetical protein
MKNALKRQQAETATEGDLEFDTSPLILPPFEAERRPTLHDRGFKGKL